MAELITVARPYAEAAFAIAQEKNALPVWSTTLRMIAQVASDKRMSVALSNPELGTPEKESLFLSVLGNSLDGDARSFVRVLIESQRISLAPEIRELFEKRRLEAEGVARAQIETALPITDAEVEGLKQALERRFGKRIEATVHINPELIGGTRIAVGDTVIDDSVSGKLAAMKAQLTA